MGKFTNLIKKQKITCDTHQWGDGQELNLKKLHIHKEMLGKRWPRGVVKIHIGQEEKKQIEITCQGDGQGSLYSELRRAFKDEAKTMQFAKELYEEIDRLRNGNLTTEYFRAAANRVAKSLEIEGNLTNEIIEQTIINGTSKVSKYTGIYKESEKKYSITLDPLNGLLSAQEVLSRRKKEKNNEKKRKKKGK